MFFIFKKIISAFILPCGLFVSAAFLCAFYFRLKAQKKASLFFLSFGVLIWILSAPIFSNYLLAGLEKDFLESRLQGDVIVVLGGNAIARDGKIFLDQDSLLRTVKALEIYKKIKKPIILSGGRVYALPSFALGAKEFLLEAGVKEKDLILEEKARDTSENAFYVKKICEEKNYKVPILISEASHLKRASYLFKKNGFENIGYAASSLSGGGEKDFSFFLPSSGLGFRVWLHENLGLLSYKIFGIISKKEKQ